MDIKKISKNRSVQIFSLLCICIYPNLFMYFQNAGEAQIADVLPIMALFIITAVVVWLVSFLMMKDFAISITLANIVMLIVMNFELLVKIFNRFSHKYICTMLCALVFIVFAKLFLSRKREVASGLNTIFLITFLSLIIVNALTAFPVIIHKMTIRVDKPVILSSIDEKLLDTEERPNIYFMIFDEYGGEKNLEKYFEYDNQEFMTVLADYGFNISYSGRNDESIETVTLLPNLFNLNYVVNDAMIQEERLAYMKEPELFKIMQYLGYDIITCSSIPFLDNSMSIKNYEEQEVFENKAGYFVLKNSCFIHLYKRYTEHQVMSLDSMDKSYGDLLIESFEYYKDLSSESRHGKPQICIGYFQAPHVPFFYRSDGTLTPSEEYENWLNHDNYIEYLKWTNEKIEGIVKTIIDNDSNSIIIIQSDHGARYPVHVGELTGENPFSVEDCWEQNYILNCLYYKGEEKDIEGLSGINTLRYVLNEEFNTNLEMIYCIEN